MDSHPCPKCALDMDEVWVNPGGSDMISDISSRQTGMLRQEMQRNQECGR